VQRRTIIHSKSKTLSRKATTNVSKTNSQLQSIEVTTKVALHSFDHRRTDGSDDTEQLFCWSLLSSLAIA
jgi:hypothetical protein